MQVQILPGVLWKGLNMMSNWKDSEYKMKVSNYETFIKEFGDSHPADILLKRRVVIQKEFPFSIITEGTYPEQDFANRWGWERMGPPDCIECLDYYSEYPACQLVLATERIEDRHSLDGKGNNGVGKVKVYSKPEDHGHTGVWTVLFLGKTEYDYGFQEWFFMDPMDMDKFVANVPLFTLGENYAD